jgi:beta-lactamase class A
MNRATFVGALAAALVTPRAGSYPSSETLSAQLNHIATRTSGRVAVFLQRISDRSPLVLMRADEIFPSASIIKLFIMLAVYQAVESGSLSLDARITIHAKDIVPASESFGSVHPGTSAPVFALLKAMIQQSDNTAGNALISYLGFADINAVIARHGFTDTRLQRYFMYFSKKHDNLTTAREVGDLLLLIARAARTAGAKHHRDFGSMIDVMLGQEDRETIAAGLPPGTPLANKTGELPDVRHDAAIVEPYGRNPYVLVVLTDRLASQSDGVAGIRAISKTVWESLRGGT